MSVDGTGIEWTDATWNPVTGCSKVSPGCANCYAEGVAMRFWPTQYPLVPCVIGDPRELVREGQGLDLPVKSSRPRQFTDVMCHEDRLDQPLRWKRPRRIFVNSMSDLFHEDVTDWFIDRVFAIMALAPQHTFQVLTKRAARMKDYFERLEFEPERIVDAGADFTQSACAMAIVDDVAWPLPNVWLGVSVENQHFADERIPLLLQTPAAVRFISAEPLLGSIGVAHWLAPRLRHEVGGAVAPHVALDWVIVGGESGKGARPFSVQWARSIVEQCQAFAVPVFVKQFGADVRDRNDAGFDGCDPSRWPEAIEHRDAVEDHIHGFREDYQGAEVRIHLINRKGGDPSEWPEDLRVRQFPESRV